MAKRVFISSTSQDLSDYRQAAIDVCNEFKFVPIGMEFFSAMGSGATDGSKNKIDESDLYIGIYAHRYGYIEEGYDKSVTEIEFDYAGDCGLDRLCFVLRSDQPWPLESIDFKNYEALDRFKKKINTLIRAEFTTVDDFKAKLISSLLEWQKGHSCDLAAKPKSIQVQDQIWAYEFDHREGKWQKLFVDGNLLVTNRQTLIQMTTEMISNPEFYKEQFIVGLPRAGKTTFAKNILNPDYS